MKMRFSLVLFLVTVYCLPAGAQVTAPAEINPVFEGDGGILANIFRQKCLGCHLSTLPAGQRGGAPVGVNFDTFATARQFGDEIVARAVELMNMPPSGPLSDEEKQALLNWKTLGFPESTLPAFYFSATQALELPEVFIIDENGNISSKVKTGMQLVPPYAAPFRFEIQQLEVIDLEEEMSQ
ncbi:MAG: hypothetical protein NMNS01_23230 [Nitrosomonas sp.]|nr:MAG: hypothetical protein NMNS01_23230 [Nitrosomonas sp.]